MLTPLRRVESRLIETSTSIKPTDLMLGFWSNQKAKGFKPDTLWGIQHLKSSVQPVGYVQGWNKSKLAAKSQLDKYTKEYPTAKVVLVPIKPPLGI